MRDERFLSQLCLEKPHYIGVELFMERSTIEPRLTIADVRHFSRQASTARRQEVIVTSVGDHVIVGRSRQVDAYRLLIVRIWLMTIVGCSPQLNGSAHAA